MSRVGSAQASFLLVAGRSLLGVVTDLTESTESVLEETTPLGASAQAYGPVGILKATLEQRGFYDDSVGSSNEALAGREATSQVVCYGYEGNTIGKPFVGLQGGYAATYHREVTRNALHKANATYTVSGAKDQGVILHTLKSETTAGNTQATAVDNTTSTANGGVAYLQMSDLVLGGYTNLVVAVKHSLDNVTYVTLGTFTSVTAAPTAERIVVAPTTVNRYLAMAWAWTGSGSSQSATFMVGFARA